MRFRIIASSLAVILLASGLASAGDSPDKKREKTRKMADKTLQELYKLNPQLRRLSKRLPDMPFSIIWGRTCCW